jgi:hypothetical protein
MKMWDVFFIARRPIHDDAVSSPSPCVSRLPCCDGISQHAEEDLRALQEAGVRAHFSYGPAL